MSNINLADKYRPAELPLYYQYRKFKWEQFFIGFFGAMAILGILMKIWNPPLWGLLTPAQGEMLFQILMPVGFIGEAIVFIMMGFLKGDGYYEITPDKQDVDQFRKMAAAGTAGAPGSPGAGGVNVEFKLPENIQRMLEEKLTNEIDSRVSELTSLLIDDMEKTRGILAETTQFATNLHRLSGSLNQFTTTLETVSGGLNQFENLNTESLSKSVTHVSGKLDEAGNQVNELQDELKRLTLRFQNFNMFPGGGQSPTDNGSGNRQPGSHAGSSSGSGSGQSGQSGHSAGQSGQRHETTHSGRSDSGSGQSEKGG